jgi:uncharacterized protein YraI
MQEYEQKSETKKKYLKNSELEQVTGGQSLVINGCPYGFSTLNISTNRYNGTASTRQFYHECITCEHISQRDGRSSSYDRDKPPYVYYCAKEA